MNPMIGLTVGGVGAWPASLPMKACDLQGPFPVIVVGVVSAAILLTVLNPFSRATAR